MDFTLRQLEYFVAAVETGSLTRAAEVCRVSLGAVSLGIRDLEVYLGHTLLIRKRSQGILPTGEGLALLPYARRITVMSTELQKYSRDLRQDMVGRVAIGCYSPLSPFVIPFLAANYATPFPLMDVSFAEGSSDDLQDRMLAGELDCVILQERQCKPGVRLKRIRHRRPHLIFSPEHPHARKSVVPLVDLENEPMILLDVEAVRTNLLPLLASLGLEPNIAWRTTQIETLRAMVARGLGWSILIQQPPGSVSYEGLPLVAREIADPIGDNSLCIAFPEGAAISYRLEALTKQLRQHASMST